MAKQRLKIFKGIDGASCKKTVGELSASGNFKGPFICH